MRLMYSTEYLQKLLLGNQFLPVRLKKQYETRVVRAIFHFLLTPLDGMLFTIILVCYHSLRCRFPSVLPIVARQVKTIGNTFTTELLYYTSSKKQHLLILRFGKIICFCLIYYNGLHSCLEPRLSHKKYNTLIYW